MNAGAFSHARPREPTIFSRPGEIRNQVTRLYHAPRERVFQLFTESATIQNTWSEDPGRVTIEELDFRPGGKYSFLVREPGQATARFHGEYRVIDPPRLIVNTFEVSTLPGIIALETDEFLEVGSFTRLQLTWEFESAEELKKLGGPELEATVVPTLDRIADLLKSP